MTWDEWENLKRQAADGGSPHTRLNQLTDSGGGGRGDQDLVVHQDDLGAIGHEAYGLHDALRKQADIDGMGSDRHGNGSTMQAAAELKGQGFTMGPALSRAVTTWTDQVNSLLQACATISNHLNYSQKTHAHDDGVIAASLKQADGSAVPVSELSKYFK
ncbi:hypothetical protein GT045_36000 [Streptomyces sp. SID486]|uniref:hypothetical protein n=1 Tax=unclassified Streptomyces TaxID=2593676 RepID=UPI0013680DC5|nr:MULTISPECIES: hypothetical protein [unclassified Streptomyces]MYW47994.1 hypothetical protein [Streptomyces sp. SID161]MYY00054.1 hypothetical protein [Streptomyces sp. SID486]